MKEYIHSGGDVTVVVASDKEVKGQPVREAFQKVLGHATIYGIPAKVILNVKHQFPVSVHCMHLKYKFTLPLEITSTLV